mmetsp:Transcript_22841/g.45182  ORF Transcript_22841/g.45182 Transcript_22841/m.45182 type:complete len:103 (-) Transcript_22841:289-597(-)
MRLLRSPTGNWYHALVRTAVQHSWWRAEYVWNVSPEHGVPANDDCAITAAGVTMSKISSPDNQDQLRRAHHTNQMAISRRLYEIHHNSYGSRKEELGAYCIC